jgi:methionyl aminopeptidase
MYGTISILPNYLFVNYKTMAKGSKSAGNSNKVSFGKKGTGPKLKEGMVIAIEPMINLGTKDVFYDEDGWTVRTKDGKFSAHYEHTICVKKGKADVLSSFDQIMINESKNPALIGDY